MKWYSRLEAFTICDELIDTECGAELTPYGAEIWPLLRELVYRSMLQRHVLPINPRARSTRLGRLKGLARPVSVTAMAKLWRNRRREDLFISTDMPLREHEGRIVNIIVDPIRGKLPSSYLLEWERDISVAERRIQRSSLIAIGGLGYSGGASRTSRRSPRYPKLFSYLEANGLAEEYWYIEMCLRRYARYLRVAARLFDIVKPRRAFLVCAYGPKMRAVLKVANGRGIETIECQHGSIHEYHPAYIFGGRDLKTAQQLLPDKLLVFGQHFKDVMASKSTRYDQNRVIVVGYPFLEEMAENTTAQRSFSVGDATTVLITSHNSHSDKTVPLALDLAKKRPDLNIVYKLHPGERPEDERYQALGKIPNIRLVTDYRVSVYDLLHECDVHVSVSSTCTFEALRFGIPSILLDLGDDSLDIISLVDGETCLSVPDDADAFIAEIDRLKKDKAAVREACLSRAGYFFAPDYQSKLERLLSH